MSYDDGETPITRLDWVDEWIRAGNERSARNCFWQRYAELQRQPAELLATIPDERWQQFIARVRAGWADPFNLSGIC